MKKQVNISGWPGRWYDYQQVGWNGDPRHCFTKTNGMSFAAWWEINKQKSKDEGRKGNLKGSHKKGNKKIETSEKLKKRVGDIDIESGRVPGA